MRTSLYEVWFSHGAGLHVGPRFKLLQDALRYVAAHAAEASFAVRAPDGTWEAIEPRHVPAPERSVFGSRWYSWARPAPTMTAARRPAR